MFDAIQLNISFVSFHRFSLPPPKSPPSLNLDYDDPSIHYHHCRSLPSPRSLSYSVPSPEPKSLFPLKYGTIDSAHLENKGGATCQDTDRIAPSKPGLTTDVYYVRSMENRKLSSFKGKIPSTIKRPFPFLSPFKSPTRGTKQTTAVDEAISPRHGGLVSHGMTKNRLASQQRKNPKSAWSFSLIPASGASQPPGTVSSGPR